LQAEFDKLGIDPAKVTAQAPSGSDNAVFDLTLTPLNSVGAALHIPGGDNPADIASLRLSWTERMLGDYDQNGIVAVNDLTPIGQNFQQSVGYDDPALHGGLAHFPSGDPSDASAGGGAANWRRARVDGNADGKVTVQDLPSIAMHFKERLSGYLIEHGVNRGNGSIEWDAEPLDLGQGSHPSLPRSLLTVDGTGPVRYSASWPLSEPQYAHYFRVRAYDSATQSSGELSNQVVQLPISAGDSSPPVWTDTVGVSKLIPSNEQISVEFGAATDEQSSPVSYRVYWAPGDPEQPGAPFDYDTADFADVAAGPYVISGLTNGQYYRVAVRAADSVLPPNREANSVLLGVVAGATDIYPPEWTERVGVQDVIYGNGVALLIWDAAVDSHADDFGTWESGPAVYRVYYGEGQTPDFNNATVVEFPDIGLDSYVTPLNLDTTVPRWFCVRVRDQAATSNEDANSITFSVKGVDAHYYPEPGPGPGLPADAENASQGDVRRGFVQSPDLDTTYYHSVYHSPPGTDAILRENWVCLWEPTLEGLVHVRNVSLGQQVGKLDLEAITLDQDRKLRVFGVLNSALSGSTFLSFDESTGELDIATHGDIFVDRAAFDANGDVWLLLTEIVNDNLLEPDFDHHIAPFGAIQKVRFWQSFFADPTTQINTDTVEIAFTSDSDAEFSFSTVYPPNDRESFLIQLSGSELTTLELLPQSPATDIQGISSSDSTVPIIFEGAQGDVPDDFVRVRGSTTLDTFEFRQTLPLGTGKFGMYQPEVLRPGAYSMQCGASTDSMYTDPHNLGFVTTYLLSHDGSRIAALPVGDQWDIQLDLDSQQFKVDSDAFVTKASVSPGEQGVYIYQLID
jgi:hypothetical protein